MRKAVLALTAILAAWLTGSSAAIAAPTADQKATAEVVQKALLTRLPRTKVNKVDCSAVAGLCEVQAGTNIFYVDVTGRFLVVGRLYDLETRQDLTASSLLAVNPDRILSGAPSTQEGAAEAPALAGRPAAPAPVGGVPAATNEKVSFAGLSSAGAMTWGGSGAPVTIFSDFHCGYCRMLHQALKELGVKVVERPISILGTRSISESVLCSSDHGGAIDKAYQQEPITSKPCNVAGLDENERFARDNNFDGTPVIVRADGAVLRGYRPKEFLAAWLKESGK